LNIQAKSCARSLGGSEFKSRLDTVPILSPILCLQNTWTQHNVWNFKSWFWIKQYPSMSDYIDAEIEPCRDSRNTYFSVRFTQWYCLICAATFTFMSTVLAIALGMSNLPYAWMSAGCNWIFTICYAGFLVIYFKEIKDAKKYWTGVWLYTVGYLCFAISASIVVMQTLTPSTQVLTAIPKWLDFVGSAHFTVGSVFLVSSCICPCSETGKRSKGMMPEVTQTQGPPSIQICSRCSSQSKSLSKSILCKEDYIFWGSVLFLQGSVLF